MPNPVFGTEEEITRFEALFPTLTEEQQVFLVFRFRFRSDKEACEILGIPDRRPESWKNNAEFKECANLLSKRYPTIHAVIVRALEADTALLAALERRKIINQAWGQGGRIDAAKAQAINDTLERVAPKTKVTQQNKTVTIADIRDASDEREAEESGG